MLIIPNRMAAIASITGTIGDLFESKLKRMAGVKDSGSFMPGHGGFLDRFDSLLFATPAVWLFSLFHAVTLFLLAVSYSPLAIFLYLPHDNT